jgi:hypothetical protein
VNRVLSDTLTDALMAKKKTDADPVSDAAPSDDISKLELNLDDAPPADVADVADETHDAAPVLGVDEPSLRPSVVSLAKQRGYEVSDDATDDDFWSRVETNEEKAERLEAVERELEQHRQWRAQVEAERTAPKTEPVAAKVEPVADDDLGIPDRPEIDQFTLGVLQLAKANGLLKEGAGGLLTSDDASLRPQIDKYNANLVAAAEYDREWGDPRKVAAHVIDKRLAKEREEREALRQEINALKSAQQVDKVQAEIDAHFAKHKDAYFQLSDGEPVWDQQKQTYAGEGYARYMAAAQEAVNFGITDRAAIHRYAVKHAPPVAAPAEPPAKKVVKFHNRLKNNGHDSLPTHPASRPHAGVGTRKFDGNVSKFLDATFDSLMNEQVAERI